MYKILNETNSSLEILLYSLISGGITANSIIEQLRTTQTQNITLRINSDGGEVFEAITLYNYLRDKNVNVIIDGICASAASIVAMSGKHIVMKQGSMMLIHNPLTYVIGEADELREQADIMDKVTASMASIYSTRTGKSTDEIMQLMSAETWMTPEEALASNFIDEIETAPAEEATQPVQEAQPTNSYEDGIKAERARLHALDELYAPGRETIINRAKYETGETAQDIALELLRGEHVPSARRETVALNNLPIERSVGDIIDQMAKTINAMRS